MKSSPTALTDTEKRAVAGLAGIFALRMLGLFLLLPVIALYAQDLPGSTPILVGLAVGAYGLTQALLQIPFGWWSDRYGRKSMIAVGLLLFILGSVIAALGEHIITVIVGRFIQGAGAIAATVLALVADLTREQVRSKIMAFIGISIGAVFMLSLVIGPKAAGWVGVKGLFWLTAGLAILALLVLWRVVPNPVRISKDQESLSFSQTIPEQLREIVQNPHLIPLDLGIFVLHLVLTAMFVCVPLILTQSSGIAIEHHWRVYLPILMLSVLAMLPLLKLGADKRRIFQAITIAIGILLLSQLVLGISDNEFWWLCIGLWVFFWGFNTLEALLPSLVSRVAPVEKKGIALGVYNTFEFLGVFVGGVVGGYLFGEFGLLGVTLFSGICIAIWLIVNAFTPNPTLFDTRVLNLGSTRLSADDELLDNLSRIPGVLETVLVAEQGVIYLKVDEQVLDEERLGELTNS